MIFKANGRYLSQEIFRPQINSMNQTVMQIKLIFQKIFNFHQLILLYLQIWRWNMVSVQWQCDNEIVKSLGYAKRFGKSDYAFIEHDQDIIEEKLVTSKRNQLIRTVFDKL
ncbi:hypothetical protein ACKWTF_004389 [Chironomus riparius]